MCMKLAPPQSQDARTVRRLYTKLGNKFNVRY